MLKIISGLILVLVSCFAYSKDKPAKGKGVERYGRAIIISISEYPEQPSWPTVDSKNDIANLNLFLDKFLPHADVETLKDEKATRQNIINAINELIRDIRSGEPAYIHFSGGGFQVPASSGEADGKDEIFMPYDSPSITDVFNDIEVGKKPDLSHVISDNEISALLKRLRNKIGKSGQVFFSIDASHFGPVENTVTAIMGRGGFIESEESAQSAELVIITACLEQEESYFIDSAGISRRSFSRALKNISINVKEPYKFTYLDLFSGLKDQLRINTPLQTPAMAISVSDLFVLHNLPDRQERDINRRFTSKNRLFIISIGINKYSGPYVFANCDDDALLFVNTLLKDYAALQKDTAGLVKTWLILNEQATKDNITAAINEVIAQAKDDDIFAFFFAGFSNQLKIGDLSQQETWFYPYTTKEVSVSNRNAISESEVFSLTKLKKMFDYIKSDKQILFTEAGPNEAINFKREFVRSMIKANPVLADIRKRNRVLMLPSKFGMDNYSCKGKSIQHGPGLFLLSQLAKEGVNVFDILEDKADKRNNMIFNYQKIQFECGTPDYEYMSFFFEKEFVEDLQFYFTPSEKSLTRGSPEDEENVDDPYTIGNKYALVIGVKKFAAWDSLKNALNDAQSISDTLRELFGFKTELLPNPTSRDIYNALYRYRSILKENDQFLLYVAGHGHYDTAMFKDGFIVGSDSKALKKDTFLTSYVPFSTVRTITDNYRAKQVMVLLDVCFSGAFDNNEGALSGAINYNLSRKLSERNVGEKMRLVTRKYITAGSRVEQVPDDYNGEHSPFAYFLLEGLRRAAKEKKYLSSGMLFKFIQSYLEDTVPLQAGFGKDQDRSGSEFIFISK